MCRIRTDITDAKPLGIVYALICLVAFFELGLLRLSDVSDAGACIYLFALRYMNFNKTALAVAIMVAI